MFGFTLAAAGGFIGASAVLGLFSRVEPFEKRRNAYEEEGRDMQLQAVEEATEHLTVIARKLSERERQLVHELWRERFQTVSRNGRSVAVRS